MEILLANLNFSTLRDIDEKYITYEVCINMVRKNGLELKYVPNKHFTREICLEAVKQNGLSIQYINEIDLEICNEAIRNNYEALSMIPMRCRSKSLCDFAFEIDTDSVIYFPEELRTIDRIEKAFEKNKNLYYLLSEDRRTRKAKRNSLYYNGNLLKHMKNSPNGLCRIAINATPESIQYVPKSYLDQDICIKVLSSDGLLIKHIPLDLLNDKIIHTAINQNPESLLLLPEFYRKPKMVSFAIKKNGAMIQYLRKTLIPDNLYLKAVQSNPTSIEFLPERLKTYELCLDAVKRNGKSIRFVDRNIIDENMINSAFDNDQSSIQYFEKKWITKEMCLKACETHIDCIPKEILDDEMILKSIMHDIYNIEYIPEELISDSIYEYAIKKDASLISFIENEQKMDRIMQKILDQFENNDIVKRLRVIAALNPGDTISSNYCIVMNHNSWYSSFWRTYAGDSRISTIEWIENTFDSIQDMIVDQKLVHNALYALNNIAITYKDDLNFQERIKNIQNKY